MAKKNLGAVSVGLEISRPFVEIENKTVIFEKNITGKRADEAKTYLSRIDHMMSCAHSIASVTAIENAYKVGISRQTEVIRELILKVEIIKSHTEYLYKKIIPKLIGLKDYIEFCQKFRKDFMRYQSISQNMQRFMEITCGRYPHPITIIVGGLAKVPDEEERKVLLDLLKSIRSDVVRIYDFIFKNLQINTNASLRLVSLWELDYIPTINGRLSINGEQLNSLKHFHSGKFSSTFVGPMARVSNNNKLLLRTAERMTKKAGLKFPMQNPFLNILCMALEIVNFTESAIETLEHYHFEQQKPVKSLARKGIGVGMVESAKGLILHKYSIDSKGMIRNARIISNVEQNKESLQNTINTMPLDIDTKTRKQLMDEIEFLVDAYYL